MTKFMARFVGASLLALFACGLASPSKAETGTVRVVFTKGGFIVGVGGGHGVLYFRGHRYPFRVSGMSVGFTIGASTTQLSGQALNLRSPGDIQGNYAVIGAGGALAGRRPGGFHRTSRSLPEAYLQRSVLDIAQGRGRE